jgi:hypothetical protein
MKCRKSILTVPKNLVTRDLTTAFLWLLNTWQWINSYNACGLVDCGEDAFLVDAGEEAELFYCNKLFLPFPIPLPDLGKELPGGTGLTAGDDHHVFCINDFACWYLLLHNTARSEPLLL